MAAVETSRPIEAHPRLLREGEVSPYKILVTILLREYYAHAESKPPLPKDRIAVKILFYRLISSEDMSYRTLVHICKEHQRTLAHSPISFVRIVESLEAENPCFLNELVQSVIDLIDTTQIIILRKKVTKSSPLGKFLRLVLLSIRKMSYPQVFYLYKQLWMFIKKDNLPNVKLLFKESISHKVWNKFPVQPPLHKGTPKPGLDAFNNMMQMRAAQGKGGLGTSLYGLSSMTEVSQINPPKMSPVHTTNERWNGVKWHSRKLIEKTVHTLCAEFYITGSKKYAPIDISNFIESIRHNPSCQAALPHLHFLEYLNSIQLKDITRCSESIRTAFDLKIKPAPIELSKGTPYAAYNFALLYDFMGYRKDALTLLNEAFQAAHVSCDKLCLHYCNNLWATLHQIPYQGGVQETIKEMDKCLSYLHSYNVSIGAFDLQAEGKPPLEIFQAIWKSTTGLDFENTESFLLISLANLFSILGDNENAGFVSELIINTAHVINWPIRNYCSAFLTNVNTMILNGEFIYATIFMNNYGQNLFRCDGTTAGELFGRHYAICQATISFLGRKRIDESVIATLFGCDAIESYYWNAYNQMLSKDWQRSERLMHQTLVSLNVKSCENSDIEIRIFLLEAETKCINGNPSGALHPLFQALRLAKKLSADFYVMRCQISICTIQIFLGLVNAAVETLHLNTLVKCRSVCKLILGKLCVLTVKLYLKLGTGPPNQQSPTKQYSVMDLPNIFELFKVTADSEPTDPKRQKTWYIKSDVDMETQISYNSIKFFGKLIRLLKLADKIFQELENEYLRFEVLYVQCEVYKQMNNNEELNRVMELLSNLGCHDLEYYGRTCII